MNCPNNYIIVIFFYMKAWINYLPIFPTSDKPYDDIGYCGNGRAITFVAWESMEKF